MLKQRVVTALILILVIGGGIVLLPAAGVAVMFALLVLLAAWEWSALSGLNSRGARSAFVALVALLMVLAGWYSSLFSPLVDDLRVRDVVGLGCLWWSIALLWVKSYPASAVIWQAPLVRVLIGLLTLVPAWLALVYLRWQEHGVAWIFVLIALVAAADIGAYFSGRAWGESKLAPAVSPGKSWAGFWGGLAASVGLATLLWWGFGREWLSWSTAASVALITTLASVLGDLLESMIKRHQGVKDSGSILPGHGGMMDRLDSMTAAAPVFALSLILVG